ncbi:MAG: hypothetical protein EOO10_11015 [Chitinophagaceae bacterium]|nr:MAG: hypothetical protein EOO10_11015 [Chitinophagaceae bacterium]
MGYEFKIRVSLTAEEKKQLTEIFHQKSSYSPGLRTQGNRSYEFMDSGTQSEMPNTIVEFEEYGIYVCQNLSSEVWTDLTNIKEWLLNHQKHFEVEEI